MIDKIPIECKECGMINEMYWSDDEAWYFSSGDFGIQFKCWNCGYCWLKLKYYPRLVPVPDFK